MEVGARRNATVLELLSALVTVEVPNACIRQWMLDSGCGCDLVSTGSIAKIRKFAKKSKSEKVFATANGLTIADEEISMNIPELDQTVTATILEDTPDVLSLGYRCAALGYEFYWPAWSKNPTLTHPDGWQIACHIHGYIPYIYCATDADQDNDQVVGAMNIIGTDRAIGSVGGGVPDSTSPPKRAPE